MGFNLLESQRHQCQHGIIQFLILRRERPLRTGRFPRARGSEFVLQFPVYDYIAVCRFHNDAGKAYSGSGFDDVD